MGPDQAALRAELDSVERTIAEMRASAAAVRDQIGGRSDGPVDAEDMTSLFTVAEEQEAIVAELEARRDGLRERLGPDAG